ncbi:MAG: hypothetical protein LW817_07060 [Candidatus Caenarcaniphilales bacterium]|nr:hypothetical protein [Candidatus Caenarcaniphilales bacterium]
MAAPTALATLLALGAANKDKILDMGLMGADGKYNAPEFVDMRSEGMRLAEKDEKHRLATDALNKQELDMQRSLEALPETTQKLFKELDTGKSLNSSLRLFDTLNKLSKIDEDYAKRIQEFLNHHQSIQPKDKESLLDSLAKADFTNLITFDLIDDLLSSQKPININTLNEISSNVSSIDPNSEIIPPWEQ